MDNARDIAFPNFGTASAEVIELLVQPGATLTPEQPVLVLEGDKASMEIPSPCEGVLLQWHVAIGDRVQTGDRMMTLSVSAASEDISEPLDKASQKPSKTISSLEPSIPSKRKETVPVPDLGGPTSATLLEWHVAVGDRIIKDQPVATLEGDKASMEIPSPFSGEVLKLHLSIGASVSSHTPMLDLEIEGETPPPAPAQSEPPPRALKAAAADIRPPASPTRVSTAPPPSPSEPATGSLGGYASPSVKRLARVLGVDLSRVRATGVKGRITVSDLENHVRTLLHEKNGSALPFELIPWPQLDFKAFGPTETLPLSKIKQYTARNLHRNWLYIPHVTQHARADITTIENLRLEWNRQHPEQKLTLLPYVMKALLETLRAFPQLNASLAADGKSLILKRYYHFGVAIDTPQGLVVGVVRDVDQKNIEEIAHALATLSEKARTQGLSPQDMQGGTFTLSSLGGIGGDAFTPIVNAPEVAILGLSRSRHEPVFDGQAFVPKLMLPLSLSYDHRVIDGAEGARFIVHLCRSLEQYSERPAL